HHDLRLSVSSDAADRALPPFPTRRSSDLPKRDWSHGKLSENPRFARSHRGRSRPPRRRRAAARREQIATALGDPRACPGRPAGRSEEHTSELQSRENLVCRLLLEKKKNTT